MPIISSAVERDLPQIDGRRQITERHVDHVGVEHDNCYTAEADFDATAQLAESARKLSAQLATAEIQENMRQIQAVGSLARTTFVYASTFDNIAAVQAAAMRASLVGTIMIADYLAQYPDDRLQAAFGLSVEQMKALRDSKLTPAIVAAANIRAMQQEQPEDVYSELLGGVIPGP